MNKILLNPSKISIDTPSLIVDRKIFDRNIKVMFNFFKNSNIKVRPHAKTHKCSKIAKLLIKKGADGICCQKLSEAEVFQKNGIQDIFITNQVVGEIKIKKLINLSKKCKLYICVDNLDNLNQLNKIAMEKRALINVLIELNVGCNRCGVDNSRDFNRIYNRVEISKNINFIGIHAYCGSAQHKRSPLHRKNAVKKASKFVNSCLETIEADKHKNLVITGGGTGTFPFEKEGGVYNEVQPGSFVFMDLDYTKNICDKKKPVFFQSLFVLTTVISITDDRMVLDAGLKSVSIDSGFPKILNDNFSIVKGLSDEHCVVILKKKKYKLGQKVLLIPGHCDPTVNLHKKIFFIDENKIYSWPIEAQGMIY